MLHCRICGEKKSAFIMNNKWVCFHCDELLFDLEIECEEMDMKPSREAAQKKGVPPKAITIITKK